MGIDSAVFLFLSLVTLTFGLDVQIQARFLYIVLRLVVWKLSCGQTEKQTDKHTDRQTDAAENIRLASLRYADG